MVIGVVTFFPFNMKVVMFLSMQLYYMFYSYILNAVYFYVGLNIY